MKPTESIVEQAAFDWLNGLDYEILSGLVIAPGETPEERSDYKQVFLFGRLQTKLEGSNPKIPIERLEENSRDAMLPKLLSGELRVPAAKHLETQT